MAKITTEIEMTPEECAQAFWHFSDSEQAQFFEAIAKVINAQGTGFKADLQWLYLGDRMKENETARRMLGAIAAPIFEHSLRQITKNDCFFGETPE